MAYARYDRGCEWYIFWQSTNADVERAHADNLKPKERETLAVWHIDHRADGPAFTYVEVREMLESSDFNRIPGFADADRDLIVECCSEFVRDVDEERGAT